MIHVSHAAASEVLRLQARRHNPKLVFRLSTQPSSCLAMSYALTFDEVIQSNDCVYECNGVQVVVDAQSLTAVDGLVLDYSEDLMGGGFRFHNPNAKQNCGCGNSFSLTDASIQAS